MLKTRKVRLAQFAVLVITLLAGFLAGNRMATSAEPRAPAVGLAAPSLLPASQALEWKEVCCEATFNSSDEWYSPTLDTSSGTRCDSIEKCKCNGRSTIRTYYRATSFYLTIPGSGGTPGVPVAAQFTASTSQQPHIIDDVCMEQSGSYANLSLIYIYQAEFIPELPCMNLIARVENLEQVTLFTNTTYVVVLKRGILPTRARIAVKTLPDVVVQCAPYSPPSSQQLVCPQQTLSLEDSVAISTQLKDLWGNVDDTEVASRYTRECAMHNSGHALFWYDEYQFSVASGITPATKIVFSLQKDIIEEEFYLLLFRGSFSGANGLCDGDDYIAHSRVTDSTHVLSELHAELASGTYTLIVTHRKGDLVDEMAPDELPYRLTAILDPQRVQFSCTPLPSAAPPLGTPGPTPTPLPIVGHPACDPSHLTFRVMTYDPTTCFDRIDPVGILLDNGTQTGHNQMHYAILDSGWMPPTFGTDQGLYIQGRCIQGSQSKDRSSELTRNHGRTATCDTQNHIGSFHYEVPTWCNSLPYHRVLSYDRGREAGYRALRDYGYIKTGVLEVMRRTPMARQCDGSLPGTWDHKIILMGWP